ncbi:alpha/beta fold hydrolase [Aequorivita nionensis]|jgi:pimeloyl-ACP methyl ester carboxylesterase|uniref:alpha/beta fold hydrolase n=1 Tax=Flavobacteriaceae TaxID=49546 RepID=UPI00353DA369|tara:strand:- start:1124 stop:2041 length:918 start_codon:yes stop_codon:yes gene_type:complete
MTLLFTSIFLILPVIAIAGYQHYKIVRQPAYDANKTLLKYEIMGSGETKLVLLHGLTGSLNYWKRNLESISKTHSLLLIDLLGFGDSPKPRSNYSLSIQMQAVELVLNKEGFNDGKTLIGGHSMGAIISLALLEKHRHWFKSGVFISIPVYKDADEFKKVMSTHSFVDRISTSKFSKYICMIHPIFMSRAFKPDNLTDEVYEDAKKHHWQSYYYSLTEVILKTNLYAMARKIKDKDVLFIHGEKDTTAPLENALKLSREFKNAQIITSSEGDHQFFLKEAEFVWKTVQDFSVSDKKSQKTILNEY